MGLVALIARAARLFGGRKSANSAAPRWIAALAVLFGLFLVSAPSSAWALPTCNVTMTVNENSSNNLHILTGTPNPGATGEIALCDPGFSGISPGIQQSTNGSSALGAFYSPNHGGSHKFETTANDDRITYTPAAGFVGTETVGACGEPGTTNCGTITFIVQAVAPSVTSVSPTSGPSSGGTSVTITGSALTGATGVSFGGTAASSFTVNSDTSITATAPAHGSGTVDITVTTTGGTSTTSASDQFTYLAPPAVTSLSPTAGPTAGGTSVVITGTGFTGATAVKFGANNASSFTVNSSTQITATAPSGSAGTVDVTVTTANGTSSTGASDQYTYVAVPTVTSLSPTSGGTSGGTSVTITGTGFSGATAVSFGGTAATGFTVNSATQITATAPAHSAATVDVRVTTVGGTSATGASDQFTYNAITLSPASPLTAGTVATAYSNTISASGGTGPYTFTVTSGTVPAGLTLATNGSLSGTPTAGGSFNFTITATDTVGGATGSQAYALTVNAPTITVTPTTLTAATVGSAYSGATFAGSGGTGPYAFTVSAGALPAGMSLNGATGALSGTPTAGGTFNFTVKATDSSTGAGPYFGTQAVSLTVSAPTITVSPNFPPNMNVGQAYSQTFTASGGTSTYSFAVTSGSIPAGMTLSSAGVLSGTPTEGGTFNFTITATDSSTGAGPYTGSHAYTLLAQAAAVTTSPTTIPDGAIGTAYSQTISGTGGTSPYTFQITGGALPAGLNLNATTGAITGTPTAAGAFTVFIVATDSSTGTGPYFGGRSYSFNIAAPTITVAQGAAPTTASAGQSFSGAFTASGGTSSYTFAVTAGALPAGVTLASNGTLSGTATAVGTFNFTVTATDSSTGTGSPFTGSQAFSLTVGAPTITLAPTSLTAGAISTAFSQTVTASGGTATYSYAVTAGALPAGLSLNGSTGAITGTPTAAGAFNFTITATDSTTGTGSPFTGSRAYSLTINSPTVTLAPSSLTAGTVGTAFNQSVTASGGTATYSYAVTSGSLPAGLSLNTSTGAITGTPTAGGPFNFTITATDSSTGTGPFTGSRAYSLTVNAPTITVSPTSVSLTQGVAAGVTFTASGGTSGYSFAVTSGSLPAGLSLNSSTGALTGSPSSAVGFNFTITATDSSTGTGPYTGSRAYSGTIAAGIPTAGPKSVTVTYNTATPIDLSTVITGAAASSVTVTSGASHGGTSVSGTTVTYTPTTSFHGSDSFQYTATGPGGTSSAATVTITVSAPTITVSPGSLTGGTAGTAYSQTISASGGQTPYAFAVTSGSLPAGLSLNSSSGLLSGTPTASGTFNFTVTATDSSTGLGPVTGSQAYTLVIAKGTIAISPTTLPALTKTVAFSQLLSGSGGVAPYSFAVTSGTLPAGLSLNGTTGTISGTPTAGGAYSFTITATDSTGGTGPAVGSQAYSGTVTILPPTATGKSVSVVYNTATPIDLTAQVAGESTGVTVSTGASHGSTSVSGYVVTYTPTPGYFGSDSFQYTADGPGGHSAPATVNINVALPAPPTANNTTVTLPYGATTLAIDLSSVMTGVATNVQVMSQPAHGTAAATGTTVNFTLLSDFTGSDSFNYRAVGPGGVSSNTATVTIVRGAPPAPTAAAASATVDYGSPGKAIDLTNSITGVASSVTVSSGPSHGTTSVSGKVVTYVPASGYQGPDSFQYTATGTGGTSAPATVTITVTAPAAPVASAKSVSTPFQTAATIDLTSSVTGAANSVAVSTAAGHGTTSVSGMVVTYTPAPGYYGSDSFAYTATGAGGTSAPATVSITVATPPAPTVAAKTASIPYGSPAAIDLSGSITGVATSVTIASTPTRGTVSVSGTTVTYTPTGTAYFRSDSFTYRATGPGGTSSTATVTVNIQTPPAPTAAPATMGVPFNGAGTAIDLTSSVSGLATSVTVSTAPAHGTATASGMTVTYKPTSGYFGPDSFQYTATGPGGTSASATVTVNVGQPPAPFAKARSVSVPYNSAGVVIDMTSSVTGVASSVTAATQPTKGTVTASGMSFTYTPTPGAFGADSFTYTATGTGGTSNTETVTLTIAPPPAPTVTGDTATVDANGGNQAIDLSGDVSGVFTRLQVTTAPSHGTLRISGTTATYKPTTDYVGADSFMFTATGPGGTSAPATVNITVRGADHNTAVPTAQAFTTTTVALTPVTVDLAQGSTGGPITAANVTSVSPSGAGTTAIVQAGSSFNMTFPPGPNFVGTAVVNFTLTSAGGTSAPSTVTITVTRPNPASITEVKGLVAAQDQAARTFARAQISNFDRRMEDLHAPGGGGSSFGMGLNFGDYGSNQYIDPNQNPLERMRLEETSDPFHQADQYRDAKLFADGSANGSAARGQGRLAAGGAGSGTMPAPGGAAIWAAGTIDLGQRSAQLGQDKVKFQSSGLTVGADMPVGEHWIMGAGAGWGHSDDQVGSGGTKSTATNWVGAIYASWEPAQNLFLDAVVGAGSLKFDTRRLTPAADFVTGSRNGSETFGSLTLAYEWRQDGFHLSPYGRLDAANASLHGYAETGNTTWALTYGSQKANLLSGDLGLRGDWIVHQGYGDMLPHFRIEARHEFEGSNAVNLQYSAALSGPTYTVTPVPASRDTVDLGIGSAWSFKNGFLFSLDYDAILADQTGNDQRFTIKLKKSF